MQNEIKTTRAKDKFLEMCEHEENIAQNPIRYGRQQYEKGLREGKEKAFSRVENLVNHYIDDLDEADAASHILYGKFLDMVNACRENDKREIELNNKSRL